MDGSPAFVVQQPIVYPESDGKPMGETDVHIDGIIYLREALRDFFRDDPQVYVAANMFFYYEEGNPSAAVSPDVFLVQGVAKHERRTYKLWEEGQPPSIVFEVTSRSTRREDQETKRTLYARLRVREYNLYDPLGEYLKPSLQGYRLQGDDYELIAPTASGSLICQTLNLELYLESDRLRLIDPATGERLLTPAEAQAARRREAERAEQEASRANSAEAELTRLRAELSRLRDEAEQD